MTGLPQKVVSFTPGFSPVLNERNQQRTVSTVFTVFPMKTVKTVPNNVSAFPPG